MKQIKSLLIGLFLVCGISPMVWAHPGHGHDGGSFSLMHYLSEPVHVGATLLVIVAIVAGVRWLKRNTSSTKDSQK